LYFCSVGTLSQVLFVPTFVECTPNEDWTVLVFPVLPTFPATRAPSLTSVLDLNRVPLNQEFAPLRLASKLSPPSAGRYGKKFFSHRDLRKCGVCEDAPSNLLFPLLSPPPLFSRSVNFHFPFPQFFGMCPLRIDKGGDVFFLPGDPFEPR